MDLFSKNQKVTLLFQKDQKFVEMVCTIANVYNDRLALSLPNYFMRYVEKLQVGEQLTVKAFSKFGTIDFNAVVINSPLEDNFVVEMDYNALKLNIGAEIPVINDVRPLILEDFEQQIIRTFEISTEFIKFKTNRTLEINQILNCKLQLPSDYGTISFKLMVTEIDPIYTSEYTATFYSITDEARQILVYYMYVYATQVG